MEGRLLSDKETLAFGFFGSLLAGAAVWFLQSRLTSASVRLTSFPVNGFFRPEDVRGLAMQIPGETEEEFIWNAWEWVGGAIPYEPIGSELVFKNGWVSCLKCYLPPVTLQRGRGNCVAKSALLSSILLNRVDSGKVRIAMGDLLIGEDAGGHAWCMYKRDDGQWYVLEATQRPKGWFTIQSKAESYIPTIIVSPDHLFCADPEMCVSIAGRCACELERI